MKKDSIYHVVTRMLDWPWNTYPGKSLIVEMQICNKTYKMSVSCTEWAI